MPAAATSDLSTTIASPMPILTPLFFTQALLHSEPYVHSLGAMTGNQAMQQVRLYSTQNPERMFSSMWALSPRQEVMK
jgi:isocitrate lyase